MTDACQCHNCTADDLLIPQMESPPLVPIADAIACDQGHYGFEMPPAIVPSHRPVKDCRFYCGAACDCMPPAAKPRPRTIIAFCGLAGAGKSTAAQHLVERHGFERIRFAGPLKDMMRALGLSEREIEGDLKEKPCALLTHRNFLALVDSVDDAFLAIGVTRQQLEDGDAEIPLLCNRTTAFAALSFVGVLTQIIARGEKDGGATPRLAMQLIGTEWGRDCIGESLWTGLWRAAVDRLPPTVPVVADDCRFPNEAAAVRTAGGDIVRVSRYGAGAGAAGHSSEGQDLPFTFTVDNNGSEADLFRRVDQLIANFSWANAVA